MVLLALCLAPYGEFVRDLRLDGCAENAERRRRLG
jgi:hypothetical protein